MLHWFHKGGKKKRTVLESMEIICEGVWKGIHMCIYGGNKGISKKGTNPKEKAGLVHMRTSHQGLSSLNRWEEQEKENDQSVLSPTC